MKKTLLSLLALIGITGMATAATGSAENPLSVDELIEQGVPASAVADTYVKGYIVGWVDGAKLAEGAKFSVPCTVASNLLLAGSSSETDVAYVIPVQLPNGDVRSALNLVDHPENLGHEVILCGSNEKYFGVNALKSISKYEWVGEAPVAEEKNYPLEATGSAQKPLTVSEFQAAVQYGTSIPNTYLRGVVVGYVPGMEFDGGVIGKIGEDVSATNILVAADAEPASLDECVPIQLPSGAVRDAINLKDNPGNLGKTITLVGVHTPYFGQTGLKEVSAYAFGDEEIVTPVEPTPGADALYAGLVSSDEGWTFDNVKMAEGLNYVWKWKSGDYGAYLNGSAYLNDSRFEAESYAVSPVIDLTMVTAATVSFDHAAKFQTNLTKDCKLVVREAGSKDWKELDIPTWPTPGSWTWVNSGAIDLKDYVGKAIELGLKYVSTSNEADTWEVKNFFVNAEGGDGVETINVLEGVYVDGNNIIAPADAQVYSINGVACGTTGLAHGLYIVVTGRKSVKVVL
ncbi:MAG: DUF5017 domain-containing protein [Muribaculaceae bacterium]|nr:DUF5017 domain-containing protein [Muribaculaceae bacterium]